LYEEDKHCFCEIFLEVYLHRPDMIVKYKFFRIIAIVMIYVKACIICE